MPNDEALDCGGKGKGREDDGDVAMPIFDNRQCELWAKGNALTRVVMPSNSEPRAIVYVTRMAIPRKKRPARLMPKSVQLLDPSKFLGGGWLHLPIY